MEILKLKSPDWINSQKKIGRNVGLVYQTYHLMIIMWVLMVMACAVAFYSIWKGSLGSHQGVLYFLVISCSLSPNRQPGGLGFCRGRPISVDSSWVAAHIRRIIQELYTPIKCWDLSSCLVLYIFVCLYCLSIC